jgi:transcription elongation factor GreA-like protein
MHKVGIISEDICEICPPDDMLQFFRDIQELKSCIPSNKNEIIVDRLYKRYLKIDQIEDALKILGIIHLQVINKNSDNIIRSIIGALNDSKEFYLDFDKYVPIRIGITEIPQVFDDDMRDLSEYDNLEGPPFWLREYLQEYPDTVLPF